METYVGKGSDLPLVVAENDDLLLRHRIREVVAGIGQLTGATHNVPLATQNVFDFEIVERLGSVCCRW